MSNNLNQAFIKAYSKDKASTKSRNEKEASDALEQFISRVDTATVSIPAPHVLGPRRDPKTAIAVPIAAAPVHKAAPESTPDSPKREAYGDRDPVRDSIASQMLKAGNWQEQPLDAFIGGFPMISAIHAPGSREPASPVPTSKTEMPGPTAERSEIESSEENPSTIPELSAPESPALSRSDDIEKAVTDFAEQRRTRGDIFRLDRPNYSLNPPLATDPPKSDADSASGEQSATTGAAASDTNIDIDAIKSSANEETTRAVEEDLRKARLRIFNPVWEVDSLQWPDVCIELLREQDENMKRVAKNLISACQEGLQILAVTSTQSGEGRTTVACCLAMLAGSNGLNVAIVDGDIENPTLSYQTNLDVEYDWRSAIENETPLEEIAVHSIDDQVTLVPLLNPIHQTEMATDDNRIAFMLHELSASFDLVIVDMGHMDSTRSLVTTLGTQGIISAVATVVDHRTSSPQRIEACIRRIRRSGISSIGLVENFAA